MSDGSIDSEFLRQHRRDKNLDTKEYIGLLISALRQDLGFMRAYTQAVQRDQTVMSQPIKTRIANIQTVDQFTVILDKLIDNQLDLLSAIAEATQEIDGED